MKDQLKELSKLPPLEHEETDGLEGIEIQLPDGQIYIKPLDQLELTPEEMKKEISNTLNTFDPKAIVDSVQYNYMEQAYQKLESINHLAVFISTRAHLVPLVSGDLHSTQFNLDEAEAEEQSAVLEEGTTDMMDVKEDNEVGEDAEEEVEQKAVFDKTEVKEVKKIKSIYEDEDGMGKMSMFKARKMKNQFDFRDRATQTFYMRPKDKECMTEETPSETYAGTVTQWTIYDAYIKNWEALEKDKEKLKEKSRMVQKKDKKTDVTGHFEQSSNFVDHIIPNLKIIERMIQLNIYNDIAYDFKYFEDAADEYRIPNGTLLPLWRFHYRASKKLVVTSLCWNYRYPDMFGVGLGSYNFLVQSSGLIVFYSLTNPSYPEFSYYLESGVMSLDICSSNTYLVVVGLYDGNVAVYNLLSKSDKSWITSSCIDKHTDPVWQVRWLGLNLHDNLTFASISSDGQVLLWTISKNQLQPQKLMTLEFIDYPIPEVEGTHIEICNGGTTFDFHRSRLDSYVLGTKEGDIRVCNQSHTNHHTIMYKAHYLSVYKVQWNDYHPDIFISCSADWTIKIWDVSVKTHDPMFSFDLGCSVEDVAWAPYSSTIFAAVTSSGHAYIFDMKFDKTEPLCSQYLVARKKTKLTKVAFNAKYPILIIGDDKGAVTTYKLSPNLRRIPKKDKKAFGAETQMMSPEEKERVRKEAEYKYLENIVSMARLGAKITDKFFVID